jgi:hypothetical protein
VTASRKPGKVVIKPASPEEIRRALKVSASEVKAAKRVIAELRLDEAVRRVLKNPSSARVVSSRSGRSHHTSR